MRGDDGAPGADTGEAGRVLVAPGRVQVVSEACATGDEPQDGGDRGEQEQGDGDRPHPVVAEVLEGRGDLAGGARVVVLDPAAQDERGAERRDERVDLQPGDDEAVGEADGRGEREHGEDGRDDAAALHRGGGDERAEADEVRHGEVEGAGEDHGGLSDGDEPECHAVLEDADDVGEGQEVPAARGHHDPAGRGDGPGGQPDADGGVGKAGPARQGGLGGGRRGDGGPGHELPSGEAGTGG